MYTHNSRQIGFHDQPHLFGGLPLNAANRWVKRADLIPWGRVEDEYRKYFEGRRGEVAKSARLALGTLILDVSCAPQSIQYPTDVRLAHENRLKLEPMLHTLQTGRCATKPRNYRQKANKAYNRCS